MALGILLDCIIRSVSEPPSESKVRKAVDVTYRSNGLKTTRSRIIVAILIVLTSLFLLWLAFNNSWAGLGGQWF